jgi:type II secretory pathway component PulJ
LSLEDCLKRSFCQKQRVPDREGVTLVELLLSLALFVLVAGSLFSVFSSGMHISQRSEEVGRAYQEVHLFLDVLTVDLENMVSFSDPSAFSGRLFQGSGNGLSFYIATPDGLKYVRYAFSMMAKDWIHTTRIGRREKKNTAVDLSQQESAAFSLLVREERIVGQAAAKDPSRTEGEEILSSLLRQEDVRFYYGYRDVSTGMILWTSSWDRPDLPVGVRVEMQLKMSEGKDDVVPLRRDILVPVGAWGPA